jgi:hypothetical protein
MTETEMLSALSKLFTVYNDQAYWPYREDITLADVSPKLNAALLDYIRMQNEHHVA